MQDVCYHLKNLHPENPFHDHSQVTILTALLLVMPPTRGTRKESLAALRRIRDYPRTEMDQDMLERLMVLRVNKELTEDLDLEEIFGNA